MTTAYFTVILRMVDGFGFTTYYIRGDESDEQPAIHAILVFRVSRFNPNRKTNYAET